MIVRLLYRFGVSGLLMMATMLHAQILPLDSATKKIVFEDVVIHDSATSRLLHENASLWVAKNFRQDKVESTFINGEGHLALTSRFLVYTKGIMSKEVHGAIRYQLSIDTKDGKYKYRFSGFVFEYYKINRQFQYKPTGKEKPLEDKKFPGWEKPWQNHKKETLNRTLEAIRSLSEAVKPAKPKPAEIPKPKPQW